MRSSGWQRIFREVVLMKYAVLALLLLSGMVFAANSIVLSIDGSGSMKDALNGTRKFELAKNATLCLIDSLQEGDEVALFLFENGGDVRRVLAFTTNRNSMRSAVRGMVPEYGGTDLKNGINVSATYALEHGKNANKVLIVVSDGGAASAALNRTTEAFHQMGISRMQVVAIGVRADSPSERALEGIAERGGGAFYSMLDYGDACNAMKSAYEDGVGGGGGLCPLALLLPAGLLLLVAARR